MKMKKYNLSKIMKRAWVLVKKEGMDISSALKKSWKEAKKMEENVIETLTENLEDMAYNDYHINAGVDRQVIAKKKDNKTYLTIACYTANGRFKGSHKCGYVDMVTNEYVCGKYDDVDAANQEYVGR